MIPSDRYIHCVAVSIATSLALEWTPPFQTVVVLAVFKESASRTEICPFSEFATQVSLFAESNQVVPSRDWPMSIA